MEKTLRNRALQMLSRREHSRFELQRKLEPYMEEESGDELGAVLDRLEKENLLSDVRMAEMLVRSRAERGKGPRWIKQDLRQRGVSDKIIDKVLNQTDNDWLERGMAVCIKRFGISIAETLHERSRRARFLIYRGFSPDQVETILRQHKERQASSASETDTNRD